MQVSGKRMRTLIELSVTQRVSAAINGSDVLSKALRQHI
jgi:hypothetical protein